MDFSVYGSKQSAIREALEGLCKGEGEIASEHAEMVFCTDARHQKYSTGHKIHIYAFLVGL